MGKRITLENYLNYLVSWRSDLKEFDKAIGSIMRIVAEKKVKCMIGILDDYFCFDLYDEDLYEIYHHKLIKMGDIKSASDLLEYIAKIDTEENYLVKFKDEIFDIEEYFDHKQNADNFCFKLKELYKINIEPEVRVGRTKRD